MSIQNDLQQGRGVNISDQTIRNMTDFMRVA